MMKVLQVMGNLNIGGAETFVMNLYRNLEKDKIQFDFVVHNDTGYFEDEVTQLGGCIYRLPRYTVINHFKYIRAWKRILEKSKPDIVHTHIMSTSKILLKEAKKYDYLTISHCHNSYIADNIIKNLIKYFLKKNIRKYANHKFSCSSESAKWFFGNDILFDSTFRIINNSIDTEKFKFDKTIYNEMKKKLGVENKTIIGHVGRFTKVKNHARLIKIFEEYKKINNNSVLILVGSGEEFESVRNNIIDTIKDSVIFLGNRTDIADIMMIFDIFIFPSFSEGFPVTLIEAQSLGLPCLISDVITREVVITDLVSYFSLNEANSKIADKINKLLIKKNNSYYNMLVKEKGFDIKDVTKNLEIFYTSCSKERIR